ncbi:DUF2249 domain-containing protein [Seongchinamella sediminis]|uniref:DUF2249 domain-containing protein n=1 Tax=Seongchinamella sediminis TaxID=2283635 RepID=A0A3L7DTY6_9GAMM|nr:DUF2249 domain-containing protein [Seongchinamella sediminis]RLQ21057.1 DUF2249 domain-containing protein [Seongchinamella sediminis]
MPRALTLDAREMAPPEPLQRATEILHQLAPGTYLHMLHRRIPYPLLDTAQGLSLKSQVIESGEADYTIIIFDPADRLALQAAGVL